MDWIAENWLLILAFGGMGAMHLFGHGHGKGQGKDQGGCGSSCGSSKGQRQDSEDGIIANPDVYTQSQTGSFDEKQSQDEEKSASGGPDVENQTAPKKRIDPLRLR